MAAITVGQLAVELLGDAKDLKRDLKNIEVGVKGLRNALGAVAAVGAGLAFVGKQVFDLGSSVGEIQSKFNTVFGAAAQSVSAFVDDFGTMAGLTRSEAKDLVATTGAIAQGMGFAEDASAKFAIEITKVAGDLASFNNLPTADTAARIQAALTGERESLKRLGIVILETDVQQRSLLNTGKENAKQLTQQEKATATLQLITERAGRAMGDLARTQDSAANQAKRIRAEFGNIAEDFATDMLPVLADMLPLFRDLAIEAANFATSAAAAFTTAIDALGLTDPVVRATVRGFNDLTDAQKRARIEMLKGEIATNKATVALKQQAEGFDFKAAFGMASATSDLVEETDSLVVALDIMEASLGRSTKGSEAAAEALEAQAVAARAAVAAAKEAAFAGALEGVDREVAEIDQAELEPRVPQLPPPRISDGFADAMEQANAALAKMKPILNEISRTIVDLITGFRSFGDTVRQIGFMILDQIVGSLIQAIAKALILNVVMAGGPTGIIGSIFGGFFKKGGMISAQRGLTLPGGGSGGIPILAHPGEAILNRQAVQALGGARAIDQMNKGGTNLTISPDFSRLPQPMTPREAALSASWQELFLETLLQIEAGGFRSA